MMNAQVKRIYADELVQKDDVILVCDAGGGTTVRFSP